MSISASKQKSLATSGLLFGAVVWGTVWYPYRLLAEAGIVGIQSNFLTYGFALMLGIVFCGRQLWRERTFSLIALGIGLSAGWANVSYILAVLQGEVMRVLLLFYLAPIWTLLLSFLLLDEKTDKQELLLMSLALVGMLTMLWQGMDKLPLPQNYSEWLSLSAGFSFALSNVLTRRAAHLSITAKSFSVWLGVCLICLAFMSVETTSWVSLSSINLVNWSWILGVGVAVFLLILLVQFGLAHIAPNRAAIIFMFELVVGAISSYVLVGEVMSLREWIGGTMIICAALIEASRASQ
ncbi:MAG: DMT family transporter [Methylophilaceae bacterium]